MRYYLLASLLLLIISSCSDESGDIMDVGVVTGEDFRRCACCGGWFIEIGDERSRFIELPEGNDLDLSAAQLPLEVALTWAVEDPGCLGDEIIVTNIQIN